MNILHVIPSIATGTGGPAISVVQLCRAMDAIGVPSTIFTTDMATPANAHAPIRNTSRDLLPGHAEEVDIRFFPIRTPHSWCYSPALGAVLRKEVRQFDLVHIRSLNLYPQFAAARACRSAGVPYIVSPHGALDPFLRSRNRGRKFLTDLLWQRKMLNQAAVIHATSNREVALLREFGISAPIIVGPYGADLSLFLEAGASQSAANANDSSIAILNHGRLHPKKGLDTAIRAMPRVLSRFANARLELIGPDDTGYGAELDRIARELHIAHAVARPGPRSGRELAERVAAANIWVLPSKGENFGIAVAEAMAAGVPVVATEVVDLAASAATENAVALADDTPGAFADVIIDLLANPDRAAIVAERGNAFARQYDWTAIAPRMRDLYESVAMNRSA